ncbi:MAG: hypothetical protein JW797_16795 [Bradymonadales bacterium]|nr:hypothetical protein [Bradymonadales bacterium]
MLAILALGCLGQVDGGGSGRRPGEMEPDIQTDAGDLPLDGLFRPDGEDGDIQADGAGDGNPDDMPSTVVVTGTVTYQDHPYGPDGFAEETVQLPLPFARLNLVRMPDNVILGITDTDEQGHFAFDPAPLTENLVQLRVLSEVSRPRYSLSVVNRSRGRVYQFIEEGYLLASAEDSPVEMEIAIQGDQVAPAFNILDVASGGLDFLVSIMPDSGTDLPQLTVLWEDGKPSPCGTCYYLDFIDLQGSTEDPDGYDDDIILHELGHFVQEHLSIQDTPGGEHDGSPTNPLLAYSEGFATFFSCWVRQSPTYQDYLTSGWKFREHETLPEEYLGTSNGAINGLVSEILVTTVMWDLFDEYSAAEPFDLLSGNGLLAGTLFQALLATDRLDLGVAGADLADFIEAARCLLEEDQPLRQIVEEVEYPFDFSQPPDCP